MMQKLFLFSTSHQRAIILEKLSQNLPKIVKNKQGTHTIQAFIQIFIDKD